MGDQGRACAAAIAWSRQHQSCRTAGEGRSAGVRDGSRRARRFVARAAQRACLPGRGAGRSRGGLASRADGGAGEKTAPAPISTPLPQSPPTPSQAASPTGHGHFGGCSCFAFACQRRQVGSGISISSTNLAVDMPASTRITLPEEFALLRGVQDLRGVQEQTHHPLLEERRRDDLPLLRLRRTPPEENQLHDVGDQHPRRRTSGREPLQARCALSRGCRDDQVPTQSDDGSRRSRSEAHAEDAHHSADQAHGTEQEAP